jgi:Tol biopolymer transport system component
MFRYSCLLILAAVATAANSDVLTSRASVANWGAQASGMSSAPAVDGTGSFVVFISSAPDLVAGDTNGKDDVFVYDRYWRTTTRVSVSTNGTQANNLSQSPVISQDGRYIAFVSFATNLVPNDTNNQADVFLHDRFTHATMLVSAGVNGTQANHESRNPSIGGNLVCFDSFASNLVANDTNQVPDVFTFSLASGEIRRVSITWDGGQPNGMSDQSQICADGSTVAFRSNANNLVADDTNQRDDIFVRNLTNSSTDIASRDFNWGGANGHSSEPAISGDGRFVAFESAATDLVPDDANGMADIFVRDTLCMITQRASISFNFQESNGPSNFPAISADGRFVSFFTFATNLVDHTLGFNENVVLHDLWIGDTSLVSRNTPGIASNSISRKPGMSGNGRFVAYESFATNLVSDDTNNNQDIYLADLGAMSYGPSQLQLVRGNIVSGGLASLQTSDDQRVVIRPGVTFSSQQDPIEVYVIGNLGNTAPSALDVFVESSASSTGIRQTVEIFDFISCTFKPLSQGQLALADSFQSGQPVGPLGDFISGQQIWLRVTYRATGPVFGFPWEARIDQVRFVTTE